MAAKKKAKAIPKKPILSHGPAVPQTPDEAIKAIEALLDPTKFTGYSE